ncbi:MAG: hypothetical protein O7D93_00635 [Acidobacteria bacterium]|nr:hypothetical protein [Acidobacteriota bacterium]MCZ6879246.1 hypothetical protein [Acidobacteriota bacterium]
MRSSITKFSTLSTLILGVTLSPLLAASSQEGEEREETFTMVAIPTKGSLSARVTIDITMRINEFSTDQEVLELLEVLREGGTDQLRRTMEKIDKGNISPRGMIGANIAAARVRKIDGGEHFIVVTARLIPAFELYVGGRSRDYPFSWFEFEIDEEGKGIGLGAAVVAAKLSFSDEGQLEVTSYGIQPFQLTNIKRW